MVYSGFAGTPLPELRKFSMKLLIDAGNTRIKWALVDGEDWVCRGDLPTGQAARLSQQIAAQLGHRDPRRICMT